VANTTEQRHSSVPLYCIVHVPPARVQLNGGEVSQLKEVLGDEFAKYKDALDKRVAAVVRANQEAKAVQEEEEARRAEEERRREEARRQREEFEREYREAHPDYLEHPKL
jgi:sRNA-binding protein